MAGDPVDRPSGQDEFLRRRARRNRAILAVLVGVVVLFYVLAMVRVGRNPAGTESGKQFRLKGKGMPVLRTKMMGDMYIQVDVETPKNLTKKQRELLEEFEKESKNDTSPESAGFFAKVKDFFDGG